MAVNLVSVTTINRTMLYRGQPGTSYSTVYTVPASTDVKVAAMVFCNTTGINAFVTVSIVNTGGTAGVANRAVSGLVIPGNATTPFDSAFYMTTGDFIAALQGTASAITVLISGETYA